MDVLAEMPSVGELIGSVPEVKPLLVHLKREHGGHLTFQRIRRSVWTRRCGWLSTVVVSSQRGDQR
jgi:hypothetical protein